jgi:hypothetical protein
VLLNETEKVAKVIATINPEMIKTAKFLYEIHRQLGTRPGWRFKDFYEATFEQAQREKAFVSNTEADSV